MVSSQMMMIFSKMKLLIQSWRGRAFIRNHDESKQGQYRHLTMEEIGPAIRRLRTEMLLLSRDEFAARAGVRGRTVDQIESGAAIDEDSLSKITVALGLPPDYYQKKEVYMPTEAELSAEFLTAMQDPLLKDAREFSSLEDAHALLSCEGYVVNGYFLPDSMSKDFQNFKETLRRCSANYHRLPRAEKEEACRTLHDAFQRIAAKDCGAKYAAYRSEDNIAVFVMHFGNNRNKDFRRLGQLCVPRLYASVLQASAWRE